MFDCIYCTELPSYNTTPSAIKMWPYKKDGLSWGGGTVYYYCIYNFTISVHLKFVLISRVPSLEGNNLVVFYYICVHLTSGLIRGVASLEEGEFIVIVFYYFIASPTAIYTHGPGLKGSYLRAYTKFNYWRGRDHIVIGFTTTYAISANHH